MRFYSRIWEKEFISYGYPILIFEILFWHSLWVGKSYFDIQNPILTFAMSRKILFWHSENPILTFAPSRKILFRHLKSFFDICSESEMLFWHSKYYIDIRYESEKAILTFKILFWTSQLAGKSYFDIQNSILTFAMIDCRPKMTLLPPGNFADIVFLKEQSFLHRIRDGCTL